MKPTAFSRFVFIVSLFQNFFLKTTKFLFGCLLVFSSCQFFVLKSAWAETPDSSAFSKEISSDGLYLLGKLPVQDGGRLKPFDSLARETLQLVYGKKVFKNKSAVEVVFTWLLLPKFWEREKIVQVRNNSLRKALNLGEEIYYSPKALVKNKRLGLLFKELQLKREREEKLGPYFQAISHLNNQVIAFYSMSEGFLLKPWPRAKGEAWTSISQLEGEAAKAFQEVVSGFLKYIESQTKTTAVADQSGGKASAEEGGRRLSQAVVNFTNRAYESQRENYADKSKIKWELRYNTSYANTWAWISLLVASIFFIVAMVSKKIQREKKYLFVGWLFAGLGLLAMIYGMTLRTLIMGRPPVTNMYETVVWAPLVALIFAAIIEKIYKYTFVILMACVLSVFSLILSGLAPAVLDARLTPLEPVLRDNFWLITHVIMIVSSYGAFFLAFAIGDLMLFYYLKGEEKYRHEIKKGVNGIYRSIQIGVVLLAGGTILGGIWADYSWGRFWGWDPKETWAFIALMGYLALLHGRLSGWFRDFALSVGSVLAFSLVIMAWYGVNFVLGAGLHSYGFGAGGVEYVSGFVALHFAFVIYVATLRWNRLRNK